MTESAFFTEFIKQYRAYLPASSELSSYIHFVKEAVDEVVSDCMRGNTRQWIEDLQGTSEQNVELTRQDALEAISSFVTEKDRIIELTRLFVRELESYDNIHGKVVVDSSRISSKPWGNRDMLMGYAVGQAIALHYNPEKAAIDAFFENLLQRLTTDNISLLIATIGLIFAMAPNSQLSELIELQREENALIQKNNELIEAQYEQMNEWLERITEVSEEKNNATDEQTEAIKENTKAIEQLIEKMDAESHTSESQQAENKEPSDCTGYDE